MHWFKWNSDVGCSKSDPLELLPIQAAIFAHGDDSLKCLYFVLSIFGYFWHIWVYFWDSALCYYRGWVLVHLVQHELEAERLLVNQGSVHKWLAPAETCSQCLLLCGSAFDHVNLDLYWGTKFSLKHTGVFIDYGFSPLLEILEWYFGMEKMWVCSSKPDALPCEVLCEESKQKLSLVGVGLVGEHGRQQSHREGGESVYWSLAAFHWIWLLPFPPLLCSNSKVMQAMKPSVQWPLCLLACWTGLALNSYLL